MTKATALATEFRNTVTLLSVTPYEEDQLGLQHIIGHSRWKLYGADRLESALAALHEHEVGVVLSEKDLPPHSWTDMLHALRRFRDAPEVIVTSRLADDRLWAEALNLGAYDVLAKPFDRDEVLRSVSLAWLNWHHKQEAATGFTPRRRASQPAAQSDRS
uniref:Response regulator receiver protein n=1 Tax=Solibacter usitatus (strain Ellin6076) TaxID=234267 RepID=Q01TM0_SOLUE